jgi:S-disulfanyl-L-cysteine oxidoreductase SoxD
MRSAKLLLFVMAIVMFLVMTLGLCHAASAQSPTYGLGKPPSADEIRAMDISISPTGEGLPSGRGSAKEGAQLYMQKCAACHGATGSGGLAPKLIKGATTSASCLSPCINDANVMAIHAPYATTLWDYINRGMPFSKERTLKPDEVYALTAFLLYKNGVIQEDDVLDAQSLPQVKMPNRDGYSLPDWKHGKPKLFP